jgi:tRNA (mo5U34)-methyltransferase
MSDLAAQPSLRERVEQLGWHHQIDLGDGIVTPGADKSAEKLEALRLPPLEGKTVLDVGAWDGYFSFAAERLGASRVLATDSFAWGGASWGSMDSFNLARDALGSHVEDRYIDVMDLSPEEIGTFDVVLFLGVLYHLRHPMLALERVASVTGELLVIETLVDLTFTRRPAAAFYPGAYMNGDDTNWWGPNTAAVKAMLSEVGFTRVEVAGARSAASKLAHTARNFANVAHSRVSGQRTALPWGYVSTDRLVVHARR